MKLKKSDFIWLHHWLTCVLTYLHWKHTLENLGRANRQVGNSLELPWEELRTIPISAERYSRPQTGRCVQPPRGSLTQFG